MAFYREGRSERDFDAGIGKALSAVLINPEFLFRVEVDPDKTAAGRRLSHQRSRVGISPVIFSLEQPAR